MTNSRYSHGKYNQYFLTLLRINLFLIVSVFCEHGLILESHAVPPSKVAALDYTPHFDSLEMAMNLSSGSGNLSSVIRRVHYYFQQHQVSVENCARDVSYLNKFLSSEIYHYLGSHEVKQNYLYLLRDFWWIRLSINRHLNQWHSELANMNGLSLPLVEQKKQQLTHCMEEVRQLQLASRFTEEFIGERGLDQAAPLSTELRGKSTHEPFADDVPWMFFNKEAIKVMGLDTNRHYGIYEVLQEGDVLLSRGRAATSASIAHMSEVSSAFSHASIVHFDAQSSRWVVVESTIEKGVVVTPLSQILVPNKTRLALYRFHDANIAAQAGENAFRLAESYKKLHGRSLPYNFSGTPYESAAVPQSLTCTQVVQWAFEKAGVTIPRLESTVRSGLRHWAQNVGIQVHRYFTMADIEVDGRFQIVGEYHDYSRAKEMHLYDAVMEQVYHWIADGSLQWKVPLKYQVLQTVLWGWRKIPLLGRLLKGRFSDKMPVSMIGHVLTLNELVQTLVQRLSQEQTKFYRANARLMSQSELRSTLQGQTCEQWLL